MKHCILFLLFFFTCTLQLPAQSLTDSLKAYYPFNGNAQDLSGFGHHGAVYGATLTTDHLGNPNSAYNFNGISNYIEINTGPQLRPATFPISVAAWIKCYPNSYNTVFISDYSGGTYYGVLMNVNPISGQLQITFGDGNYPCTASNRRTKTGTTVITDGQWHAVAGVIRSATDMDLYVDCQNDGGSYNGSGGGLLYSGDNKGRIGMYLCDPQQHYFNGAIDELRFYHRELKQSDITALYYYPNTVNPSQPVNIGNDTTICGAFNLTLNANTPGATSYQWSNGQNSPSITVTNPGTYWVTVNLGLCFQKKDTITISNNSMQTNLIDDMVICEGQTGVTMSAPAGYASYSWSTGASSPSISVVSPGVYSVTAIDNNGCVLIDTATLTYSSAPTPAALFNYGVLSFVGITYTLSFNNLSQNATTYLWDFGDGTQSNMAQPIHTFSCNVFYAISLIATNECGSDTFSTSFYRNCIDAIQLPNINLGCSLHPNPSDGKVLLAYELPEKMAVKANLFNSAGRQVWEKDWGYEAGKQTKALDFSSLPNGAYYLLLSTPNGQQSLPLLLKP